MAGLEEFRKEWFKELTKKTADACRLSNTFSEVQGKGLQLKATVSHNCCMGYECIASQASDGRQNTSSTETSLRLGLGPLIGDNDEHFTSNNCCQSSSKVLEAKEYGEPLIKSCSLLLETKEGGETEKYTMCKKHCITENPKSTPTEKNSFVDSRSSVSIIPLKVDNRAFDIADRLLQGEVLTDRDVFHHKIKRKSSEICVTNCSENCGHCLNLPRLADTIFPRKKLKHPKELIDILISDLDEITEIPFFDIKLPREIALKIFQHLDMIDLCHCAQVNKSWRRLSEDELLWSNLCHHLGYKTDITTSEQQNWKCIVKDTLLREKKLRLNWKNRIGRLYELEDSSASIFSAVHSCQGYVVAGYTNGKVNLWNVGNDSEEELQCLINPENHIPNINLDLSNAVTSISINPIIIVVGYELGQVCILKQGVETKTPYCSSLGSGQILATQCIDEVCAAACNNTVTVFSPSESPVTLRHSTKVGHINLLPQMSSERLELITASSTGIYHHTLHSQGEETRTVHHLVGSNVTAMDISKNILVAGITSRTSFNVFQVPVFSLDRDRLLGTLLGHSGGILCLDINNSPSNLIVTGCRDKHVRVYDLRTFHAEINISAHTFGVTQAQIDENHIVTGGEDGFTCVWDLRSQKKLWEMYNRHPVKYLKFDLTTLVTANIPENKFLYSEDGDSIAFKKQRGCLRMYDFSVDQEAKGIPSICLSAYDEPAGYNYNIKLAVPYDSIE